MDISKLKNVKVPKPFSKLALKASKHSPEIFLITGGALLIGATVDACRQTTKAHEILKRAENDISEIEKTSVTNFDGYAIYSETDARNDRIKVYTRTTADLVKTYSRPVLLWTAGFAMVVGGHKILKDRNVALTSAYSGLLSSYMAYRDKVAEMIGEDKEFQIRSGFSKQDIELVDEDGQTKKVKSAKVIENPDFSRSIYARIFDEGSKWWSPNPSTNLTFLRSQQNYANDKLRVEGVLFLNEVYEMLDFPKTPEGQIVGWVFDPSNPDIDSYVDFGIYDKIYKSSEKRDFINGHEPCVWLDFNVDGVVYNLL